MESKLLIDAIVRQTTILLARLSTAAGIRAPMAHVADQVFLDLSREIEAQGVGRKVAADMFGLALRTYQKKVQRLTQSESARERSLWQAVFEHVQEHDTCTRQQVLDRFRYDDEAAVAAVLNDLVNSGLLYATGRGAHALFGITDEAQRKRLGEEQEREALVPMVWLSIYREPATLEALVAREDSEEDAIRAAVTALESEGRVERDEEGCLRASQLRIDVGAQVGWEAAVFDHFQAVANAIAAKVGAPGSRRGERIGGATVRFDIHDDHPHRQEVLALLGATRASVSELWQRVAEHNEQHPILEEKKQKVTFYFGQHLEDA